MNGFKQEVDEEAYRSDNTMQVEKLLVEKYPIDLPQSYIDTNKEAFS